MCTATWLRTDSGYELFFNRDELRARGEARPPRAREAVRPDGTAVSFLAPEDPDFGGTWIAVNDSGVSLAVLNGFRSADYGVRTDWRSRGLLVIDLAGCRTTGEIEQQIRGTDLDAYRSFRLLALGERRTALVAEWDRRRLAVDGDAEKRVPLVSSSFEEGEVGAHRRAEYRRIVGGVPTRERLLAYHKSHENGPSAFSVCMHREDAATRSFTHVRVGRDEVELAYHGGPPCEPAPDVAATLPRRKACAA
ncbi:MAG: NRDE family protein [Candidatus Eiseniibacteriota bacterium]